MVKCETFMHKGEWYHYLVTSWMVLGKDHVRKEKRYGLTLSVLKATVGPLAEGHWVQLFKCQSASKPKDPKGFSLKQIEKLSTKKVEA